MSGGVLPDYLSWRDTVKTIAWFPGRASSGKGDAFPVKLAREQAAERLLEFNMPERVCLFVGKGNASSYNWMGDMPGPLDWREQNAGGHWAWFLHTSGIVQFWNSEDNRTQLRQLFSEARQLILPEKQKIA